MGITSDFGAARSVLDALVYQRRPFGVPQTSCGRISTPPGRPVSPLLQVTRRSSVRESKWRSCNAGTPPYLCYPRSHVPFAPKTKDGASARVPVVDEFRPCLFLKPWYVARFGAILRIACRNGLRHDRRIRDAELLNRLEKQTINQVAWVPEPLDACTGRGCALPRRCTSPSVPAPHLLRCEWRRHRAISKSPFAVRQTRPK